MQEKEQEISLYDLIKFYIKNWLLIVSLTVLGLGAGLVYSLYLQTPLYKSNATLLVVQPGITTGSNDTIISSYVELFKSRRVLEPVMNELQVTDSHETFSKNVEASNNKNTAIIRVAVISDKSEFSKLATDKAILSFQNELNSIYDTANVRVVDGASLPTNPYNVNILIQTAIATIAGFLLSVIGLFFAYDYKQSNKKTKHTLAKSNSASDKDAEAIAKSIQNEERKRLALELKIKRIEANKAKREAKMAATQAAKKAEARRKAIVKKARDNKIQLEKAARALKRQEKMQSKKLARLEKSKKRKATREALTASLKQLLRKTFSPLLVELDESKTANRLKREIRKAELLARHEERMAEIEAMKVKSIEKRANIAKQSKKIEDRIAKDDSKSSNKPSKSKNKTETEPGNSTNDTKKASAAAKSSNAFYASIQNARLNRRGLPFELSTTETKSKRSMLGRIKRNITKQINSIKNQ
jgi:capsular polysaccharide biosynthesis protein